MTDATDRDAIALERHFAAARRVTPQPSAALMARVLEDAQAAQRQGVDVVTRTGTELSWIRRALAAVGGWPALGGMAAATVAGLWIGFSDPTTLPGLTGDVIAMMDTSEDVWLNDLMPDDTFGQF